MTRHKQLIGPVVALALLTACGAGLPGNVRREISLEVERVEKADRQVRKSEAALNSTLASAPNLFRGAAEVDTWKTRVTEAKATVQAAERDSRELVKLAERNRPDRHIEQLLAEERRLRESALQKAQSVDEASAKWLEYQRDPAGFVARIKRERETIRAFDLAPVTKAVHRAEQDWPAKKTVLESRLSSLADISKSPDESTQANVSTLIAEEETLSQQAGTLEGRSRELEKECGQLYDSWDKVLTDLERSQIGGDTLFRERLKTVRTHFTDVPLKKTETSSDEHWTDVSEGSFHAVENDIGMAVAHKDAGQFDAEAQNTPQPPGFSYVAAPSVGSNQYGYWSHSGGESVWTFLPQYLILRELLWNRDYHPVLANEYNAYRVAQSRGTTYYGQATPAAAPKYGTHGTFTQAHYGDSRYVQAGGFKGSAYASGGSSSSGSTFLNRLRQGSPVGQAGEAGKRFGREPNSAPLGQHFGRAPSSRPAGRSFGRRR